MTIPLKDAGENRMFTFPETVVARHVAKLRKDATELLEAADFYSSLIGGPDLLSYCPAGPGEKWTEEQRLEDEEEARQAEERKTWCLDCDGKWRHIDPYDYVDIEPPDECVEPPDEKFYIRILPWSAEQATKGSAK
jgi:hypothetical protein